ncbi:28S ribosomal protein S21, mitochondrial [Schistosoma japonicum]|nr:28S ribosomal protein S21, mitochondrial [Schistosoma japonicum]
MSKSSLPLDTFFKNFKFLKKTVVVINDDYNSAYKALSKILTTDKVIDTIKFQEYYERPTEWRRRFMYERCKRIYDSEMSRKISLVVRTHRVDPWPR